jgi:hypothetical protein
MTSTLDRDLATTPATPASMPRSRQVVGGACLLLVPVGWAIAEILAPESGSTASRILSAYAEHRDAGLASSAVSLVTLLLFLPAFFALVSPITGRGRRWAHAGLAALVYSTITIAVLLGINLMFHAMTAPGLDRHAMVDAVDQLMKDPLGLPVLAGHWVMGLGVLFIGIAVVRSGRYAAWAGYAIIGWFVVDLLASMLPVGEVAGSLASNAFGLAGLGSIGLGMLRNRD